MTIGSSFDHPAHLGSNAVPDNPWAARYPNPPDLCFDYRKLVEQPGGMATAADPKRRIAIVGAGIAGLCAARELVRMGFDQVTLFEQSARLGGRHLTLVDNEGGSPFEMGAMRIPFFNLAGEHPTDGRSLMAYYAGLFDLKHSPFPNPGTPWVTQTGIYLREGCIEGDVPKMLLWNNPSGEVPPPTDALRRVHDKWLRFAKRVCEAVSLLFGTTRWDSFWAAMVDRYASLSFRELVLLAPTPEIGSSFADFGGLGMSREESRIFYAIGIGDGSWGAFYDVCCLYPIRTAIFGFSSHLQLVHGRVDANERPLPAPFDKGIPRDSSGLPFDAPAWLGIAALDDAMMYLPIDGMGLSLYEHLSARPNGLLMRTSVTGITGQPNGTVEVAAVSPDGSLASQAFDEVIITIPSWILETQVRLEGFDRHALPFEFIDACRQAHWESSCKVYLPLDKSFLGEQQVIPQIMVTDSFIHDVYAYRYGSGYESDCLLLSYTWEDDANKLAAFEDSELIERCLAELDRILLRCVNIGKPVSPYVDVSKARVQRWLNDRGSHGCARLYRAGTYGDVVRLMAFNRDHSNRARLYFAGESYSADAGWTEPALRGAIDAVIHLASNTAARFKGGFTLKQYPEYHRPRD